MKRMKNLIKFGLVLGFVVALMGCEKEEAPPVVVEKPAGAIEKTLGTAKEKAEKLKETTGEAIGKATDSVLGFKDRASEAIKNVKLGSDDE